MLILLFFVRPLRQAVLSLDKKITYTIGSRRTISKVNSRVHHASARCQRVKKVVKAIPQPVAQKHAPTKVVTKKPEVALLPQQKVEHGKVSPLRNYPLPSKPLEVHHKVAAVPVQKEAEAPQPVVSPVITVKKEEQAVIDEHHQEDDVAEPLILGAETQEGISIVDAVICHEFSKYWQAPEGVNVSCQWFIHISPQGKYVNLEWSGKEPVSALAIAIRAACSKIAYPRQLWGKTKLVSL